MPWLRCAHPHGARTHEPKIKICRTGATRFHYAYAWHDIGKTSSAVAWARHDAQQWAFRMVLGVCAQLAGTEAVVCKDCMLRQAVFAMILSEFPSR